MKHFLLLVTLFVIAGAAPLRAQMTLGSTAAPNAGALLDAGNITASAKSYRGVLLPQVALTSTAVYGLNTLSQAIAVNGMIVYNTLPAGSGLTAVVPGIYVWQNNAWQRVTVSASTVDQTATVYTADGALTGNRVITQAANNLTFTTTTGNLVFSPNGAGKVGIGTATPAALLDVMGNLRIGTTASGSATDSILTINTKTGLVNMQRLSTVASSGWKLTGNKGTVAGTNFIGTTDTIDLVFKRNNIKSGLIGDQNTSFGSNTLVSNTTGTLLTAIGNRALGNNTTGSNNVAVGSYALASNTTGYRNTAVGRNALGTNTTGIQNSAVGFMTLLSNSTGSNNVGDGYQALADNTTGSGNTAVGFQPLWSNTTGGQNVGVGTEALFGNTTGSSNTAVGAQSLLRNNTGYSNDAFGYQSLLNNTTGFNNTAIGNLALLANTSGYTNVAVGNQSLQNNTTGVDNTATGFMALSANTTGYNNTANGYQALNANTTGVLNTAMGMQTLAANTTGINNTGIGAYVLKSNTTGGNNNGFGFTALYSNTTGYANNAIGSGALYSNTTGGGNLALGNDALRSNTTGVSNVASGLQALSANTSGVLNVATGSQALYLNTIGIYNTASGAQALYNNTTGNYNSGSGTQALYSNTTGNYNTADGVTALFYSKTGSSNTAFGAQAQFNNATGSNNTSLGHGTLNLNKTGSGNTAVGFYAGVSVDGLNNATAIGNGANVTASNVIQLGNTAVTMVTSSGTFTTVSDERFKYDVQQNVPGLAFISKLKPVTYRFDDKKLDAFKKSGVTAAGFNESPLAVVKTGFLAQQVETAAKEIGYKFDGVHTPTGSKDYYSLAYAQFVVPLVQAVQELNTKVEALEAENLRLKAAAVSSGPSLTELASRIEQLEKALNSGKPAKAARN